MSIAEIQEIPSRRLILLAGTPGAGKSTFCHQMVLNSIAAGRPVIFVTTEQSPSDIAGLLRDRGMTEAPSGMLNFVDAFGETAGLATTERPDTVYANCEDLNSISMAIAKQQQKIGKRDILLSFDSLTSPYLFNKEEVFRFMRLCLTKFAAEGNSVVALMDEGCGKKEDLGAMMSVADGIIKMEVKEGVRIIDVVKHPTVAPKKIEVERVGSTAIPFQIIDTFWESHFKAKKRLGAGGPPLRTEVGDIVNIFWRDIIFWGGMLWDPKRFPSLIYDLGKEFSSQGTSLILSKLPWYVKLAIKASWPKRLSEVKNVKKVFPYLAEPWEEEKACILEYIDRISKTDEHYFRMHESATSWGLKDIGASLCYSDAAQLAGMLKGFEKERRNWNVVETACVGEGSPYCEFKAVPGELDERSVYLTAMDSAKIERIEHRLMEQVTEFVIHRKPLGERPRLGSGVFTHYFLNLLGLASERYRMALRMGGAKAGKEIGERLMNAGLREDEVIRCVFDFMEYCKVGKITLGETIRMKENCESFGLETGEPTCFFTTGFLNGLFSAVKNQHVREIKCVAAGDPYCEWEFG
jgi:predicted hydrocarbon binding protein/KaiC/GvpD/RAD55 family RecA-like ATPase